MELMQTDFPEPVEPAISRWGIFPMSAIAMFPAMSRPSAADKWLSESRNTSESMISRMVTAEITLLGTSMPTAALLGIGASMRTPAAARLSAMSSARPVILLILTPADGWSSYRVTAGPREISTIRVCTPKLARVSTSRWALAFISSVISLSDCWRGARSRCSGGIR